MAGFTMRAPRVAETDAIGVALLRWGAGDPLGTGLQAGDFGWLQRNGAAWVTENFLVWDDAGGELVAGGFREGKDGLWLQIDPARVQDRDLARAIVDGAQEAGLREVSGPAAPSAVRAELAARGAAIDPHPWPHLWRPLTDADLIEVADVFSTGTEHLIGERIAVQRSAFENSTFTREKWAAMAGGPLFRPDLDLVALNGAGVGVSALTAWFPAGAGCGVIEPMGTHRDHWRQGHGSRVLRASFAALRRLGADGVRVGVERSNAAAIAAYASVGFRVVGYDTTMLLP
ncbi:MAG TPA: GNAT family N-acetyltransferase [Thermomicrobiales bacterium]|nr:GNAT family N-acetyltransferase [Thermomicrobiales bacterium]